MTSNEAPNFPNASYVIAAAEWNFWMSEDTGVQAARGSQEFRSRCQAQSHADQGPMRTVQPGEDIVGGLRALDTSGHTAGHIAIEGGLCG
jgi:glyoxylase-like metal-dependent hydrolase (beta-lactamase superfamily II)